MQRVKHVTTEEVGTVEDEMYFFGLVVVRWDKSGETTAEDAEDLVEFI